MHGVHQACGEDERDIHFSELCQCHQGTPVKVKSAQASTKMQDEKKKVADIEQLVLIDMLARDNPGDD